MLSECACPDVLRDGEPHKIGPNLHGFFGEPAATRMGYNYSSALESAELTWDKTTLKQWLRAPSALAAGTTMVYHSQMSDSELEQLVNYLADK